MVQLEIQNKLNNFLTIHDPLNEECQIVYLMVEIRKLIEQDTQNNYPLLKFYCDWCVHTKKDVISKEIANIMPGVYSDMISFENDKKSNNEIHNFAWMKDLEKEVKQFLNDYNLPKSLIINASKWKGFFDLLTKVLAEQPLNNPHENIKSFTFKRIESTGIARIEIEYKSPLSGKYEIFYMNMGY